MSREDSAPALEPVLREVVETLARPDRTPCSPGEREAAEWLAACLGAIGGTQVALEHEDSWGTFAPNVTALGLPASRAPRSSLTSGAARPCRARTTTSGVAALVALAELLRARPVRGLQVWLVSCGAEETPLQDGVRAFIERHRQELSEDASCVVNLETIGSPHLAMLEAEGPIWMQP